MNAMMFRCGACAEWYWDGERHVCPPDPPPTPAESRYISDAERANWDGSKDHKGAIRYGIRANQTIAALLDWQERCPQKDERYYDPIPMNRWLAEGRALAAQIREGKP